MKKLLLVLLVVALASFLFAGCLPVTPSEGEGEGEGEGEVPVAAITVEDEYDDGLGTIYVRGCSSLDVTVTFAEAVAADQDVWVRLNDGSKGDPFSWYLAEGSGTVFVAEDVSFPCCAQFKNKIECIDCEPLCIEVMVGDVCCSEVIYHETRTIDSENPYLALYLSVEDCGPCDDMANILFTSSKLGECDVEEECCGDDCSGVAGWTVEVYGPEFVEESEVGVGGLIDFDMYEEYLNIECETPCFEDSGVCPIDGSTGCLDCLVFGYDSDEFIRFDGSETVYATYLVKLTLSDNVGNKWEDRWSIGLDSDEIVGLESEMVGSVIPEDGVLEVYNLCEELPNGIVPAVE